MSCDHPSVQIKDILHFSGQNVPEILRLDGGGIASVNPFCATDETFSLGGYLQR
jgi:hypothetical protein